MGERTISIIGGGIGGLVLALELEKAGIGCEIYEAAPRFEPLGVGINVLPHASAILHRLGLGDALAERAIETTEAAFYTRFGQHIYSELAGRAAGHEHPQYSIHRGDLHEILIESVRQRIGGGHIHTGHRLAGLTTPSRHTAVLDFADPANKPLTRVEAAAVVGCDGIHSVVRKHLHPDEGPPRYSGVMMWRGVSVAEPFLTGATMVRAGWLNPGKLVVYPIRNLPDGRQLINWVAEIEAPVTAGRDWQKAGRIEDFADRYATWAFDWLDVPALIAGSEQVLEYPMVDQDPLPHWGEGCVTLLGDAAHPMVPRGSNGAGQAILDAAYLAEMLIAHADDVQAFAAYRAARRPATAAVVEMNRTDPPDAILRTVHERSGDAPVASMADVLPPEEARSISRRYLDVTAPREETATAQGEPL